MWLHQQGGLLRIGPEVCLDFFYSVTLWIKADEVSFVQSLFLMLACVPVFHTDRAHAVNQVAYVPWLLEEVCPIFFQQFAPSPRKEWCGLHTLLKNVAPFKVWKLVPKVTRMFPNSQGPNPKVFDSFQFKLKRGADTWEMLDKQDSPQEETLVATSCYF